MCFKRLFLSVIFVFCLAAGSVKEAWGGLLPGCLIIFDSPLYIADEDEGRVEITVKRIGDTEGEVTAEYSAGIGIAEEDTDYKGASGTLVFKDGENECTFYVDIVDDDAGEGIETVAIKLENPSGEAMIGIPCIATLSIIDDDSSLGNVTEEEGKLEFSQSSYSVDEDDGSATITVERSDGSDGAVAVDYSTSEGTAWKGSDYTETSGTLLFESGVTSRTFSIKIKDDDLEENSETIKLKLSDPTNGAVLGSPSSATLTIKDDEDNDSDQEIEYSSSSYSVDEDDGSATIAVKRRGGSSGTVKVDYYTRDGTAREGDDYTKASGTLTFSSGVTTRTFTVRIKDDNKHENDETVRLYLEDPSVKAELGSRDDAVLTIKDEDDKDEDDNDEDDEKDYDWETNGPVYQSNTLIDIFGHWAQKNIKSLIDSGAIKGYPDRTFRPDYTITRAEFATLLVKALNLEPKAGIEFADTSNHWARSAVATAWAYGIVNGYNNLYFGPDDPITREQMAMMVVKAAQIGDAGERLGFSDSSNISSWAKKAVAAAVEGGIMTGYPDNTFRPGKKATRAEAVTIIANAISW